MKLSNRATLDVVAAHALYRLHAEQLNDLHRDKQRRLLKRTSLIDATMTALKARAINACRRIGISDDEIVKTMHAAMRAHYRIKPRVTNPKKVAEAMDMMQRSVVATPLG